MKSRWYTLSESYAAITAIFGNEAPTLDKVEIKELVFHQDGPSLIVKMDLEDFPANVPAKWLKENFNTISLHVEFVDVSDIHLHAWTNNNPSRIEVSNDNGELTVGFSAIVGFKCKWIHIKTISAYRNEIS